MIIRFFIDFVIGFSFWLPHLTHPISPLTWNHFFIVSEILNLSFFVIKLIFLRDWNNSFYDKPIQNNVQFTFMEKEFEKKKDFRIKILSSFFLMTLEYISFSLLSWQTLYKFFFLQERLKLEIVKRNEDNVNNKTKCLYPCKLTRHFLWWFIRKTFLFAVENMKYFNLMPSYVCMYVCIYMRSLSKD